jgi:hypothetical protein
VNQFQAISESPKIAGCIFGQTPEKTAELAETAPNCYSIADRFCREPLSVCKRAVTPRCEAYG